MNKTKDGVTDIVRHFFTKGINICLTVWMGKERCLKDVNQFTISEYGILSTLLVWIFNNKHIVLKTIE